MARARTSTPAGSRTVRRRAAIAARGGAARIAIVADTHSAPHGRTAELLGRARPHAILHAGDIGSLSVVDDLAVIAPTFAVRGNIDGRASALPDELVIDVRDEDRGESLLTIFVVHIAVYGPKLRADVARRARAEGASIVVCGHSHVPFIGRDQGLVVFNPGSIGPRRFHLPIVFGLMDVGGGATSLHMEHVSCETGERWLP